MHLRNKVLALIDVLKSQRIVSDELDVVVMSDAARAIVPDTWNRQGFHCKSFQYQIMLPYTTAMPMFSIALRRFL